MCIRDRIDGEGAFQIRFPIEEILGPNFAARVEGVARIGSARNPQGTQNIDFLNGGIIAVFEFPRDQNGNVISREPYLVTLFPEGDP